MSDRIAFIADVHLGKLARLMRMLGFDVAYENYYSNEELIRISKAENRILLTRSGDTGITTKVEMMRIEDEEPNKQLIAVLNNFDLKGKAQPCVRCLKCNGQLIGINKEAILDQLQANTIEGYNEFWQCANCGKLYWKGSHWKRMMQMISAIKWD